MEVVRGVETHKLAMNNNEDKLKVVDIEEQKLTKRNDGSGPLYLARHVTATRADKAKLALKEPKVQKEFTREEVAKHNTLSDFYIIYNNLVFDLTGWLKMHPGGGDVMKKYAGKDCTEDFKMCHAWVNPLGIIGDRLVGRLKNGS